MGNRRVEIVVPSCYGYRDAWRPFSMLLDLFWNGHYQTALVTDRFEGREGWGQNVYSVGSDHGWAKNLAIGLAGALTEYIVLMQEDFFINGAVDHDRIEKILDWMETDQEVSCTRLMPCPGPDLPYNDLVGLIDQRAPYRVSCQAAIWKRSALYEILMRDDIWSPADFEIVGTMVKPPGIYASVPVGSPAIPYFVSAISRGKWNPQAYRFCESLSIPIDTSLRALEG